MSLRMIDSERMTELEDEIGAEDLGLILAVFLDEATETFDRIGLGIDPDGFARAMHFLRSGALNMGLRGFAATAAEIEGGSDVDQAAAVDRLRDVLDCTREQIAASSDRPGEPDETMPRMVI